MAGAAHRVYGVYAPETCGAPGLLGGVSARQRPGGTLTVKFACPRTICTEWIFEVSRSEAKTVIDGTSSVGKVTTPSIAPAPAPAQGPSDATAASDKRARS